MFTFDKKTILQTNDIDKVWDAYEEVCARISSLKSTRTLISESMLNLKQDLINKIKKLEKNEH